MVLFAVVAENQFFRLMPIDAGFTKILLIAVICASVLFVVAATALKQMKVDTNFILLYLACITLFVLAQFCYSMLKYREQTVVSYFQMSQSYLWIFVMVPILYLFTKKTGMIRLLEIIKWIVACALLLHLLHAVIYNVSGQELLQIDFYKELLSRNGRLRVWDLCSMEALAIIWCFYQILTNNSTRTKNIVLLVIMMGALYYLEQSRMMQICLIASMAIMYVLKRDNRMSSKIVKVIVVVAVAIFILISGIIEQLYASFSVTGEFGSSTYIRLDEMKYAMQLIIRNPINGAGLVSTEAIERYIRYYGRGSYGYTDIGILGVFGQIGLLWTTLIYIWPMCRAWNVARKAYKRKNEMYPFLTALFMFLLLSSGTLFVLNLPRIFMWPWCIAIFEYCGYCIRKNEMIR